MVCIRSFAVVAVCLVLQYRTQFLTGLLMLVVAYAGCSFCDCLCCCLFLLFSILFDIIFTAQLIRGKGKQKKAHIISISAPKTIYPITKMHFSWSKQCHLRSYLRFCTSQQLKYLWRHNEKCEKHNFQKTHFSLFLRSRHLF